MDLSFNLVEFLSTFDVMWKGMLAIFVVLFVIFLCVLLMLKLCGKKADK